MSPILELVGVLALGVLLGACAMRARFRCFGIRENGTVSRGWGNVGYVGLKLRPRYRENRRLYIERRPW